MRVRMTLRVACIIVAFCGVLSAAFGVHGARVYRPLGPHASVSRCRIQPTDRFELARGGVSEGAQIRRGASVHPR